MPLLFPNFQVFVVDPRGQGRSTWTPGRYTVNSFGEDLVRFIDLVIGRPVVVAGNSLGGVLAAWLAAYAKPRQVRGVYLEDPPLFASETTPAIGHSIRQVMGGSVFASYAKWLGDQWSVGNWQGWLKALPGELPDGLESKAQLVFQGLGIGDHDNNEPPQHLKEYDPEIDRSMVEGRLYAGADHETLLKNVRTPVLLSHHLRIADPETGYLFGALSDLQARHVGRLVEASGQPFTYKSFPRAEHRMHASDPRLYVRTLTEWATQLGG